MEFVDIAGIVKGASEGAGLGNKFLTNIRQTDAIIHLVRCFKDDDVIHVDGGVDPLRDIEVINMELALSDMAQIERRLEKCTKDSKYKTSANAKLEIGALERLHQSLSADGTPARLVELSKEEQKLVDPLMLLTMKPMLYATNVADTDLGGGNDMTRLVEEFAAGCGSETVVVSAQVEAELCELPEDERRAFLESLDVTEKSNCGLKTLIHKAYKTLGLQTYFTSGPTETRAWTIRAGFTAPQAAGVIHTDFEKGFIRAEVTGYEDLVVRAEGSEKRAKDLGLVRSEGKDYIMREGDIALFRFN
jgi:ribosome-binding ATPase